MRARTYNCCLEYIHTLNMQRLKLINIYQIIRSKAKNIITSHPSVLTMVSTPRATYEMEKISVITWYGNKVVAKSKFASPL